MYLNCKEMQFPVNFTAKTCLCMELQGKQLIEVRSALEQCVS